MVVGSCTVQSGVESRGVEGPKAPIVEGMNTLSLCLLNRQVIHFDRFLTLTGELEATWEKQMKWVRCDSLDGKPGAITQSGRNKVGRETVIIKLSVTLISHRQILSISQSNEFK